MGQVEVARHERWAVVDGPDGTRTMVLPTVRLRALEVKGAHPHGFWCSRLAGGCGGSLIVRAGELRVPHFAHARGSTGCAAFTGPEELLRGYEHLQLQRALQDWLAKLGFHVRLEQRVGGGRVDVLAQATKVRHVIEVQRSPLPVGQWALRSAVYASAASTVTWLWGTSRRTEADLALTTDGVAFLAQVDEQLSTSIGTLWVDSDVGDVNVGWDPLTDCRMDDQGLWTPHRAFAVDETNEWRARRTRAEMEQARARENAELESQRLSAERAEALRTRLATMPRPPKPPPRQNHTLARRRQYFPEVDHWHPPQGWDWLEQLPPHLHESARHLAFFVTNWHSFAVSDLEWDDVPDPGGAQVRALLDAGFIEVRDAGIMALRAENGDS